MKICYNDGMTDSNFTERPGDNKETVVKKTTIQTTITMPPLIAMS
jgi:hypothetical protein